MSRKRTTKRSAESGQFVTHEYAKENPATTVRERRRHWRAELAELASKWRTIADAADSEETVTLRACAHDLERLIERQP